MRDSDCAIWIVEWQRRRLFYRGTQLARRARQGSSQKIGVQNEKTVTAAMAALIVSTGSVPVVCPHQVVQFKC